MRQAGWPIVLSRGFPKSKPSHQCGTARMGADPATSVVDANLKAHDLDNLYIVDASVLPTSAAVNPSLTIAALALRAGDHIAKGRRMTPRSPLSPAASKALALASPTALAANGLSPRHRLAARHRRTRPSDRRCEPLAPTRATTSTTLPTSPPSRRFWTGSRQRKARSTALIQNAGVAGEGAGRHAGPHARKFRLDPATSTCAAPSSWRKQVAKRMLATPRPALPLDHLRHLGLGPDGQPRTRRLLHLQGRRRDGRPGPRPAACPARHRRLRTAPRHHRDRHDRGGEGQVRRPHRRRAWFPPAAGASPPTSAQAVVPLVTGQMAFATGAVIPVDGGLSIERL